MEIKLYRALKSIHPMEMQVLIDVKMNGFINFDEYPSAQGTQIKKRERTR